MNNIYNTAFEISLRVLLLLNTCQSSYTADRIAAIDTMSVYEKNFGFASDNLHGDNSYYIGEFAAKRRTVQRALKRLVLDGYVVPAQAGGTLTYSISGEGKTYAETMSAEYAREYCKCAELAIAFSDKLTDRDIIKVVSTTGGAK